jgi:hypothetical protein
MHDAFDVGMRLIAQRMLVGPFLSYATARDAAAAAGVAVVAPYTAR